MGWMWSSPAPPSKGPDSQTESNKPAAKEPQSVYGDVEIDKFMAELQAGFGSKPAESTTPSPRESEKTTPSQATTQSSSSWFSWGSSKPPTSTQATPSPSFSSSHPDNTPTYTPPRSQTSTITPPPSDQLLDPITESLLPTTMSCRNAFDAAFHCNSLGGQWTSVYRAGSVRSCSEQWDDFWFCMRTRAYSPPQKAEAIRAHYRAKEIAKYHSPGRTSSTDVWEPREEKLEPGTAFRASFDMPDVSDEEWRLREIERRMMIQEMLKSERS